MSRGSGGDNHRRQSDGEPRLDGLDRAEAAAAQDGHLGPLPFLVGLAAADPDAPPARRLGQVGDLERHQLGGPKRGGEAKRQQRAVAGADRRGRRAASWRVPSACARYVQNPSPLQREARVDLVNVLLLVDVRDSLSYQLARVDTLTKRPRTGAGNIDPGSDQGNRVKESCADEACQEVIVPSGDFAPEA